MQAASLGTVLKAALIAGILAGLVVSAFHYVATEPVFDQVIALEEQMSHAAGQSDAAEPMVSREEQRGGLFVGFAIYGIAWGLLFTLIFQVVQRWLPPAELRGKGWFLAGALYWAVALLPFLKYPANPPGVGDPETVGYRQGLYVSFLMLSAAATILAVVVSRSWNSNAPWGRTNLLAGLGFLAVAAAVLYFGMPDSTDPVQMPANLVFRFRTLSLAGLTLFWAVYGVAFGRLIRNAGHAPAAART